MVDYRLITAVTATWIVYWWLTHRRPPQGEYVLCSC